MAHDKASSAQTIGWHLTSREGALTARIQPGMQLGEDDAGEMSFDPSHALVEFDIEDGTLVVRVASDAHELEVPERGRAPTVYVDPQTQVQLSFPSNTVSIDTGSATTSLVGDRLQIRVVPGSGDAAPKSRPKTPSGPPIARFLRPVSAGPDATDTPAETEATEPAAPDQVHEATPTGDRNASVRRILVPEVLPAESSRVAAGDTQQGDRAQEDAVYTVDEQAASVSSGVSRAVIFAAILLTVFVGSTYFIFQTQTQPRTPPQTQAPTQPPSPTQARTPTETPTQPQTPAQPEPQAEAALPIVPIVVTAEDQPGIPVASAQASSSAPAESQALAERPESGSPELLAQIAALAEAEELPDTAAVDFAVQSLKTLHLAYPNDPDIRRSLEALTERLASEAMLSYDGGDAIGAGRLIAQASLTGVAQESVSDALVYLAAAQAAAANRQEQRSAGSADAASRAAERETAGIAPRDSATDRPQTSQIERPPAFQPAPGIYPYVVLLPQTSGSPGDQTAGYREPGEAAGTNADQTVANRRVGANPTLDAEQPAKLYPLAQLNLTSQKLPPYPRRAPEGSEGSVDLLLTVTEAGDVGGVEILGEAPDYFTRAAMEAVLDWKFEPVVENGQRISVRTAVRVSFRP